MWQGCEIDLGLIELELSSLGVFRNARKFKITAGPIHPMADLSVAVFSSPKTAVEKIGSLQSAGCGAFQRCAFLSLIHYMIFKMPTCSKVNECLLNTGCS